MRLLPKDNGMGWATYAMLAYLGFFLIDPIMNHSGLATWAWTGLGLLLFLTLYFSLFWTCGWKTVACAVGVVLLGMAYLPFNSGAVTFFIYGASFLAYQLKPNRAFQVIAAVVLVLGVELYLLRMPAVAWFVDMGLVAIISVLNVYFA